MSLIFFNLNSEVRTAFDEISDVNARILYELIKENIVDIKIVLKSGGMYHDKLAILEDFDGNVVACVGSNNESEPGYNSNYEKIRVYKSWLDYEGRIEDETKEFESIWSNTNDELSVYDFKDAFKAELLERVEHKGNYTKENKYKMRQYQKDAKEEWIKNGNKGFFVMATGTGKTITSLYSIKDFINNNQIFTVIAVPYKHLVNQWAEDVKEFFPNAKIHLVHGEIKDAETKILASYIQSKKSYSPIIVITTIVSFFLERYENLYNQIDTGIVLEKLLSMGGFFRERGEEYNCIGFSSESDAYPFFYNIIKHYKVFIYIVFLKEIYKICSRHIYPPKNFITPSLVN